TATAVYVTHDQVEALTMGDRIAVMNDGCIHQVGAPGELYDSPVDRFVASFIGTPAMGFVTCGVERRADGVNLLTGSVRIRVSAAQARALDQVAAARVVVGARPECLAMVPPEQAAAGAASLRGAVEAVEMLGAEQYVHVTADGGSFTARLPRNLAVSV